MQDRYKLLCLDLDGTLLNDQKQVTERTRQYLQKAKERGIEIALLSGRMPFAIELIERQIGFPCIKAASAGTYILMDDRCISSQSILPEVVLKIYHHYARTHKIPLWIFQKRKWYVTERDHFVEHEVELVHYEPEVVDIRLLAKEWEVNHTGPNKLLFGAEEEVITQLKKELEKEKIPGIDFARSSEFYLEIYPLGADKGTASCKICDALGILPSQMFAIGDQELDIPMLKAAGLSVAMGNAPDHVKKVADFVTKSNEEDGVAYAMERFLF